MSCYVVGRRDIHLVTLIIATELRRVIRETGNDPDSQEWRTQTGRALLRENLASYYHRYEHNYDGETIDIDAESADYVWEDPEVGGHMENPYFLLKSINHYEYQACEHPTWETCPSHDLVRCAHREILKHIGGGPWKQIPGRSWHNGGEWSYTDMPEYDGAPWELDCSYVNWHDPSSRTDWERRQFGDVMQAVEVA